MHLLLIRVSDALHCLKCETATTSLHARTHTHSRTHMHAQTRANTNTLVTKRYPAVCQGRRKNVVIISAGCPHTNTLTHPCTAILVRSFIKLIHSSPHNQNLPIINKCLTVIIMKPEPQHKSNTGSIWIVKQPFQVLMTSQYVSTSPNCPPFCWSNAFLVLSIHVRTYKQMTVLFSNYNHLHSNSLQSQLWCSRTQSEKELWLLSICLHCHMTSQTMVLPAAGFLSLFRSFYCARPPSAPPINIYLLQHSLMPQVYQPDRWLSTFLSALHPNIDWISAVPGISAHWRHFQFLV